MAEGDPDRQPKRREGDDVRSAAHDAEFARRCDGGRDCDRRGRQHLHRGSHLARRDEVRQEVGRRVMSETGRHLNLYIPWATIGKVVAALMLVWMWLRLWPIVMAVLVALVLAVTLDPLVRWLERRGLGRGAGVALIAVLISIAIAGGVAAVAGPIADQSSLLIDRLASYQESLAAHAPASIARILRRGPDDPTPILSYIAASVSSI